MSSSSSSAPDHHHLSSSSPEKLCYVHCSYCDTILACSLRMLVQDCYGAMWALHQPPLSKHESPPFFQSASSGPLIFHPSESTAEEIRYLPSNLLINQQNPNAPFIPVREIDELPTPPAAKRPPEKRQRVPSAYNRFIKDEIQRIKAGNPDISHREAFSAAAKNWAHFPHIHFGLMPDQLVKKPDVMCLQEGGDDHVLMKDGFLAAANMGLSPY
ncbi:hypothetical protein OROMI_017594 [Orobanche minor]